MTPEDPSIEDVGARLRAVRLVEALGGLDLTSADGRAGIGSLLSEIERLSPGHASAGRTQAFGYFPTSIPPRTGNAPEQQSFTLAESVRSQVEG